MRITREQMFSRIVKVVAKRSTCLRKQAGALIVKNNRIISMGYNGAPKGMPHCLDIGCLIGPDGGCIRTAHAEANAIAFAASEGIKTEGATLYCTISPCLSCAKLIINSGIVCVVYLNEYRDKAGLTLLSQSGISTV